MFDNGGAPQVIIADGQHISKLIQQCLKLCFFSYSSASSFVFPVWCNSCVSSVICAMARSTSEVLSFFCCSCCKDSWSRVQTASGWSSSKSFPTFSFWWITTGPGEGLSIRTKVFWSPVRVRECAIRTPCYSINFGPGSKIAIPWPTAVDRESGSYTLEFPGRTVVSGKCSNSSLLSSWFMDRLNLFRKLQYYICTTHVNQSQITQLST